MFGSLIALGIFTRVAAVPLMVVIGSAIYMTKIPILEQSGVWAFLHEGRTDFCMLLGLLYLIIAGAGAYAYDAGHGARGSS